MILSFAKALEKRNINYQQDLLVEATDISDVCAYMTYIQLSLYGIPAVVYCGDSLSQNIRFKLETPLFYLQYWKFRKMYMQENEDTYEIVNETKKIQINDKPKIYNEVIIKGNNQLSLW